MGGDGSGDGDGDGDGMGGSPSGGGGGTGGASGGLGGMNASGGASFEDLPEEIQAHCERMEDYACEMFKACQGWTTCDQHPITFLRQFCQDSLPGLWAEGKYTFDAELAESCLPDQLICPGRWADLFDTHRCRDVFQGTIPLGDECGHEGWIFGSTCDGGRCAQDSTMCTSTCEAYADEGESCDTVPCAPGARCVDGFCVQPPEWGESCSDSCVGSLVCSDAAGDPICLTGGIEGDPCSPSLPCASRAMCQDGVCVGSVTLGQECNSSFVCPSGATCYPLGDEAPSTCNETKALGVECESPIECGTEDVDCLDPDPEDQDFTQVCTALSGVGGPCEPGGCQADLWCQYPASGAAEEGICRLPGGLGDSCASGEGPRSNSTYPCLWTNETRLFCVEDECRVQPELGDACNPDDHDWDACLDSWCSFSTRQCMAPNSIDEPCNLDARLTSCDDDSYCLCETEPCDEESDSGVCAPRKPNTALCWDSEECQSNYCDGERCDDPPLDCSAL